MTNLQARKVASEWYGGQECPLYALVSTGSIVGDVLGEIESCIETARTERKLRDTLSLERLHAYVSLRIVKGKTGPIRGWTELHW